MTKKIEYKCLTLIAILMTTIMQISIVVAYKPVLFHSILLPGGVIGFPLVFTMSDVVAEVYGYKHARRMLWQALGCTAFFVVSIMMIIKSPSPLYWKFQGDYNVVFGNLYRILLAVALGITLSSFINIYIFSKWKILVNGKHFWLRCGVSSAIGEAIVTIIADMTAFLGTIPMDKFIHMVASVYIIKLIYSFIAAFPATMIVLFLKRHEKVDIYDYSTNFNPFSLKL